ncbi:MAG: DUF664 domain-containing protein [Deinococcales bacterium]|nr:DUF664 domain-containing protein [Deinococcales bacterium]
MTTGVDSRADLLFLAFERNSRVNAALLAAIEASDLPFASGGWSIGKLLCHLASFRRQWLAEIAPKHAAGLRSLADYTDDGRDFEPLTDDLLVIADAFRAGDAAVVAAVHAALTERRPFPGFYRSDPTELLVHVMVHDAHHRGQIMSLLRQRGRSRADMIKLEDATWLVWRE